MAKSNFDTFYNSLDQGANRALIRRLWEAAGGTFGGSKKLRELQGQEYTVKFDPLLVDEQGRFILSPDLPGEVYVLTNEEVEAFYCSQPGWLHDSGYTPELGLARMKKYFSTQVRFASRSTFIQEIDRLKKEVTGHKMGRLFNAPSYPICFPQTDIDDMHKLSDKVYGRPVANVWSEEKDEGFIAYNPDSTTDHELVPGSRYSTILEKTKLSPVCGIYFPMAFHLFSQEAFLAMIKSLPEGFVISSWLDIALAVVGYPKVFTGDRMVSLADGAYTSKSESHQAYCFYNMGTESVFCKGFLWSSDYAPNGVHEYYNENIRGRASSDFSGDFITMSVGVTYIGK